MIEKCNLDWTSPILLADKKEKGTICMCVNYRVVNVVKRGDAFPMPTVEERIDDLG